MPLFNQVLQPANGTSANAAYGYASDPSTGFTRSSAGNVMFNSTGSNAVLLGNTTVGVSVAGGSGGFLGLAKSLSELTTIAAAATTTTVIQLPVNAIILAVSVRVTVTIPTAATFTVTTATPAKTWNTVAVSTTAGTTDAGTAPGPTFQTTASVVTITPNLTPGTNAGRVRVTLYYYDITPATV